jgi:hypothetical protein
VFCLALDLHQILTASWNGSSISSRSCFSVAIFYFIGCGMIEYQAPQISRSSRLNSGPQNGHER